MTNRTYEPLTEPTAEVLSNREKTDYCAFKESFLTWLESVGKHPEKAEGYAESTVKDTRTRIDRFYRWMWSEGDRYTTAVSGDEASEYMRSLVMSGEDYSNNYLSNEQKAVKRLFKWLNAERGASIDWNPSLTFGTTATNPRDFLTGEERKVIRTAAIEYGSVPAYEGLDAEARERWKANLAQRFDKPAGEIGRREFGRANGWKIPSLVWTSLDAGLRPIEVERSRIGWVDVGNRVLRIPAEESSKGSENWTVSITTRTAEALDRWLKEREQYEKYDDTDALWLNREGNPYASNTLAYLLRRLFEVAGIPTDGREVSWYSIRHSVGTHMARERGLKAAKEQLRHRSSQTTLRYDAAPVEERRDALERMG